MENLSAEEILDTIIENALVSRASDIHIDPYEEFLNIAFRIDGKIKPYKQLDPGNHPGIISRIKVLARLPLDDRRLPKDGRFKWIKKEGGLSAEVRVSMMPTPYGENAVLRLFDQDIAFFTLNELGFSDQHVSSIQKALSFSSGIVVVAGPTGSGKTTTLYAMLSLLNSGAKTIITIEDPIERRLSGIRQIEVGGGTLLSFNDVLRSVLRQDPDIIMVGEIRDREGAELALQSALTGHLVLSTIHASSANSVRSRLTRMGVSEYLIDATLRLALSTRLVSRTCNPCSGKGCDECGQSGVRGRIIVSELSDSAEGLDVDANRKAAKGLIPMSEAIRIGFDNMYE